MRKLSFVTLYSLPIAAFSTITNLNSIFIAEDPLSEYLFPSKPILINNGGSLKDILLDHYGTTQYDPVGKRGQRRRGAIQRKQLSPQAPNKQSYIKFAV